MAGLQDGRVKTSLPLTIFSQYGGSKPEVVNKNSEKLEHMVYLLFYTS